MIVKYSILVIILGFLPLFSLGQKTVDSVTVEEEMPGSTHLYCKNLKNKIHRGVATKKDSLSNCLISKTFKTDHVDIYYVKEFDLRGKLREEGYAKNNWVTRNFLGIKLKPKLQTVQKDGAWKFYDALGNKISDCCYKDGKICDGCLWSEYDEQGYKIKEYKINW